MKNKQIYLLLFIVILGCGNTYTVGNKSNNYSPKYKIFIRNENLKDSVYVVDFDYLRSLDGRECLAYIGSDSMFHFFLIIPKIAKQGTILSFAVKKDDYKPKKESDIKYWNTKKAKREWIKFEQQ